MNFFETFRNFNVVDQHQYLILLHDLESGVMNGNDTYLCEKVHRLIAYAHAVRCLESQRLVAKNICKVGILSPVLVRV